MGQKSQCQYSMADEPAAKKARRAFGPIGVWVTVTIKEERVEKDFYKAMEKNSKGSRGEPGCLRFDVIRDRSDENKFYFYEVYVDDDAFAFHKTTEHFKAWADFKASGGVEKQEVVKFEAGSMPGDWPVAGQ